MADTRERRRLGDEPVTRRTFLAATGAVTAAGLLAGSSGRAGATDPAGGDRGGGPSTVGGGDQLVYTPYLYLRYRANPADLASLSDGRLGNGAVPANNPFWLSPDILVDPVDSLGNPVAGTDVTVSALVFNAGLADAVMVLVEFFWFDPSLALTGGNAHRIGSTFVAIPDHQFATVTCPQAWRPQIVNSGHECLVVQCSTVEEGTGNLRHPFDAALDRHVAQRNLTVVSADEPILLGLTAVNQFTTNAMFTLGVSSTLVRADLGGLRELGPRTAMSLVGGAQPGTDSPLVQAMDVTGTDFGLRLNGLSEAGLDHPAPPTGDLSAYLRARGAPSGSGRVIGEFGLDSGRALVADIGAPPSMMDGERFLVHQVIQAVQGVPVGGYTVVVPPRLW